MGGKSDERKEIEKEVWSKPKPKIDNRSILEIYEDALKLIAMGRVSETCEVPGHYFPPTSTDFADTAREALDKAGELKLK